MEDEKIKDGLEFEDFIIDEMAKRGLTPSQGKHICDNVKILIQRIVDKPKIEREETPISVLLEEDVS